MENIIIYRKTVEDAKKMMMLFFNVLKRSRSINDIKINYEKMTIQLKDNIFIDFRCGKYEKMAGVKPNYFNTYGDKTVSNFLMQGAYKIGGKEMALSEIFKIIREKSR